MPNPGGSPCKAAAVERCRHPPSISPESQMPTRGLEYSKSFCHKYFAMKIAVLLSGGVDSSVALHQVKTHGFTDITAYYLKIWLEDDVSFLGECPWEEDLSYAREVCRQAGVELRVLPLQLEYYDKVVSYALAELKKGRTPSPDIFCNQRIKFGAFFDAVDEDYDLVVTGHYADVRTEDDGLHHLYQAPDGVKDQSYFLSHLSQEQVAKLWFPLGNMQKPRVRELAESLDLPNKARKDSQGICFLGKIKYPDFVRHYLGEKEGAIVRRENGEQLGTHKGFWFHTIGQRTGLGLGNGPWYVVDKDSEQNIVYVSHKTDIENAFYRQFICTELTWIAGRPPEWLGDPRLRSGDPRTLRLKLRHGPKMTECRVRLAGREELEQSGLRGPDLADSQPRLMVEMTEGDKGLAPGQFAVFYLDDECIGSGKIQRAMHQNVAAPGRPATAREISGQESGSGSERISEISPGNQGAAAHA